MHPRPRRGKDSGGGAGHSWTREAGANCDPGRHWTGWGFGPRLCLWPYGERDAGGPGRVSPSQRGSWRRASPKPHLLGWNRLGKSSTWACMQWPQKTRARRPALRASFCSWREPLTRVRATGPTSRSADQTTLKRAGGVAARDQSPTSHTGVRRPPDRHHHNQKPQVPPRTPFTDVRSMFTATHAKL